MLFAGWDIISSIDELPLTNVEYSLTLECSHSAAGQRCRKDFVSDTMVISRLLRDLFKTNL
jgi:hypothetical protein